MNGRVSKLIHAYAATYAHVRPGTSGRTMERIAKREWKKATKAERRALETAMLARVAKHGGQKCR